MTETRYTLFLERRDLDVDDDILATGLSLPDAARMIRGHGGARPFMDYGRVYGSFRAFELRQYSGRSKLRLVIGATVPTTEDREYDRRQAIEMIDIQTVERHREFWDGCVVTDLEYAERMRWTDERRKVRALDREIVTKLVESLLTGGSRISGCMRFRDPPFEHSRARKGLLKLLFDLDMAELFVHKDGGTSWILLVFGESGWDVIGDYSVDLAYVIEPIVESHLPWNKADAAAADRGYSVVRIPSPAALEASAP